MPPGSGKWFRRIDSDAAGRAAQKVGEARGAADCLLAKSDWRAKGRGGPGRGGRPLMRVG